MLFEKTKPKPAGGRKLEARISKSETKAVEKTKPIRRPLAETGKHEIPGLRNKANQPTCGG